jgi:hypothetical protein
MGSIGGVWRKLLTELERWHGWKHPFLITPFVSGEPSVTLIRYFELPSLRSANTHLSSSPLHLISDLSRVIPSHLFLLISCHLLHLNFDHPLVPPSSTPPKLSTTNPLYLSVFFPLCLFLCHCHEHRW